MVILELPIKYQLSYQRFKMQPVRRHPKQRLQRRPVEPVVTIDETSLIPGDNSSKELVGTSVLFPNALWVDGDNQNNKDVALSKVDLLINERSVRKQRPNKDIHKKNANEEWSKKKV